jgi:hypothetical protein
MDLSGPGIDVKLKERKKEHVLSVGYMTDFFQKQLNLSKF